MVCTGPFHPQQFCDSVGRGCAGAGQHALFVGGPLWLYLVVVHIYAFIMPNSRVGLRLLIQPFRLWKGLWIFYSFKANPHFLDVFGVEKLTNAGVPSADPLVPKACPSHGDLVRGRVRICCLQSPQSPCDRAMGTHCCARHSSAPCPSHKQVPLSPCLCFLEVWGLLQEVRWAGT